LLFSCPIGTTALKARVAGNPVDQQGIFIRINGSNPDATGIKIDDNLPPVQLSLSRFEYWLTDSFILSAEFTGYVVDIVETVYNPQITTRQREIRRVLRRLENSTVVKNRQIQNKQR
jgi:hypothetical protein